MNVRIKDECMLFYNESRRGVIFDVVLSKQNGSYYFVVSGLYCCSILLQCHCDVVPSFKEEINRILEI